MKFPIVKMIPDKKNHVIFRQNVMMTTNGTLFVKSSDKKIYYAERKHQR